MGHLTLTILTGLSGSGKSTALRALEDSGYYCIDNLPLTLTVHLLKLVKKGIGVNPKKTYQMAIVIDARGKFFFKDVDSLCALLLDLKNKYNARILYLEARREVLLQRFSASRRRHPLSLKGSVLAGIDSEKKLLTNLKKIADKIIDTSDLNVHELIQLLNSYFHLFTTDDQMHLSLISFGYKYGIPIQSDLIFDVRFLPNPYFEKKLSHLTGKNSKVRSYVVKNNKCSLFLKKTEDLLAFLIHEYKREGKAYLTLAFGCTGGKHRSVAIVEEMKRFFNKQKVHVFVNHRDINI